MYSISCFESKISDPFLYLRDIILNDLDDCLHGIFPAKCHLNVQGSQICRKENDNGITLEKYIF